MNCFGAGFSCSGPNPSVPVLLGGRGDAAVRSERRTERVKKHILIFLLEFTVGWTIYKPMYYLGSAFSWHIYQQLLFFVPRGWK